MDLYRTIRTLKQERERLAKLIESLEHLEATGGGLRKLRGNRGRKGMTLEERQKVSARMKKYWAARRQNHTSAGPVELSGQAGAADTHAGAA